MTPLKLVPRADANAAHLAELAEDLGMRLVCSWCSRVVRDVRGAETSHVLCAFCAQRLLEEDRSPK